MPEGREAREPTAVPHWQAERPGPMPSSKGRGGPGRGGGSEAGVRVALCGSHCDPHA